MPPVMKKLMPNYDPNATSRYDNAVKLTNTVNKPQNLQNTTQINYSVYKVSKNTPYFRAGMRV